jgi:NAD(P)-dependent dehydrogenase (short-subunit alcohol dehydrogenase family)
MVSSGGGHIINVSSRSGLKGKVGQAAYSASKAGMLGLTLSQARELGRRNIRVNALLPGYMPTEMGQESERALELAREESELNVIADIQEAATFLLWLVSTKNITGQVFSLDSRINGW